MSAAGASVVARAASRGALLPAAALRGPTGRLHRGSVKPTDNTMVNLGLPVVDVSVDTSGTVVLAGRWLAWVAFGEARLVRDDIALIAYADAPRGDRLQSIGGLAIVSSSAGMFLLWGPRERYGAIMHSMESLGLPVTSDRHEWTRIQLGTFDLVAAP